MSVPGKREDMIVHEQDPYNAEPPRGALAQSALTPVSSFYSRNHGPIPQIDPGAWSLHVGGLVDCPLELTLPGLKATYGQVTLAATLQCAGNNRKELMRSVTSPGRIPGDPVPLPPLHGRACG